MPATPALRAMTMKTVNDANEVLDEITLDGGRQMWTQKHLRDFIPRLTKWMSIWEETGRRHGLTVNPHSMQNHRDLARQGNLRPCLGPTQRRDPV